MDCIFDNVFIGGSDDLPFLAENGFDACLSISDLFELQDKNEVVQTLTDDNKVKFLIPNLNSQKIHHMILSLSENADNQIGTILPFAFKFLEKHLNRHLFIHCVYGQNQSVAILFAFMIYKGVDPFKAYSIIANKHIIAKPYIGFIKETLDFLNIPIKKEARVDVVNYIKDEKYDDDIAELETLLGIPVTIGELVNKPNPPAAAPEKAEEFEVADNNIQSASEKLDDENVIDMIAKLMNE